MLKIDTKLLPGGRLKKRRPPYVLTIVQMCPRRSVEAIRYNLEGRGFDSRWCHWNWHNPSGRTMTLGSTQLLTEMGTRNISWGGGGLGKGGRCLGLTTLPPSCIGCFEIWEPHPPGTLRACPGLYKTAIISYPNVCKALQ